MKTKLTLLAVITGLSLALPALRAQDGPPPPPPGGGSNGGQGGGCHGHHGGKPAPSQPPEDQ